MSAYKMKKQLKSTVTNPIHSSNFASRGEIDLINLQNSPEINRPNNFLLVYQDHLTKFVVLRPWRNKSADEVVGQLLLVLTSYRALMVRNSRT